MGRKKGRKIDRKQITGEGGGRERGREGERRRRRWVMSNDTGCGMATAALVVT